MGWVEYLKSTGKALCLGTRRFLMLNSMSSTEDKVLEIIWDFGGEASISTIVKEAKITPDYARLICRDLAAHDYIKFDSGRMCSLKGKGKLEAAKMKVSGSEKKKVVIPEKPNKFGLGRNKRGRLFLDY